MRPYVGIIVAGIVLAAPSFAADEVFNRVIAKLDLISDQQTKPGQVIVFTQDEINAWAKVRVPEIVPEGIRDQRVELGMNTGVGSALVDFIKMRHAGGAATNPLLAALLEGERPLKVAVRLESSGGKCTVFLTRLEVNSFAATGGLLDLLVKTFFIPLYPDSKMNEPFELGYDIDRIEIRPDGVRVTIKQ